MGGGRKGATQTRIRHKGQLWNTAGQTTFVWKEEAEIGKVKEILASLRPNIKNGDIENGFGETVERFIERKDREQKADSSGAKP